MNNLAIIGIDYSLNHVGLYLSALNNPEISEFFFLSTVKKDIKNAEAYSHISATLLSKKEDTTDRDVYAYLRQRESTQHILGYLSGAIKRHGYRLENSIVAIEGYAYSSRSGSLFQIAEACGHLKNQLCEFGARIRIYDPTSLKLFAVNNGDATKKLMTDSAIKYINIPQEFYKATKRKKRNKLIDDYSGIGTDLADAYFLNRMLTCEMNIRNGIIDIKDLSDNERQIFLRTSKSYPTNLLTRDFISVSYGND
jgi:Holliday junction resolvasome RuvABC endonuclease subunit